jgi:DNA repair exonuclease SbcCD nuclease subunit
MAQGTSGAEAIISPFILLRDFINNIPKVEGVFIVGGNHDRLAADKSEENAGEGAKLIAFMLNEVLDVEIKFDPGMVINDADPTMRVIILHGDYPVDKETGQSVAWEHGDPAKFNYIATAHMHTRKQEAKNDGLKFRKEALPAFCPSDSYAKTVAHPSMPGYKIVSYTKRGFVTIDRGLIYEDISEPI